MTKVILQLDTLTCPSCMTKIQSAITKLAGVQNVKVLFNASKVKVLVDDQLSGEDLKRTVEKLGYQVQNVKTREVVG
ncbi:heavy-metal-associated domain-containing protein [Pediococcus acidilactici]|nr:copper chaperone [Pediococcus acidilactici]UWF34182.1 heavy-metal-associated domain-containing protein [Pediococcus acidilactici]